MCAVRKQVDHDQMNTYEGPKSLKGTKLHKVGKGKELAVLYIVQMGDVWIRYWGRGTITNSILMLKYGPNSANGIYRWAGIPR